MTTPTGQEAYLAAIYAPTSVIYRRCDIFESDGDTPYLIDAPIVGGSVSVDQARAERRIFDLVLNADKGGDDLRHHPGGLWYDKVIRLYRGVITPEGGYESQIGEFVIDSINRRNFSSNVSLNGRDYTKRLITSKFPRDTAFRAGEKLEDIVEIIASNGGIRNDRMILPATGITLPADVLFERGMERKAAIDKLVVAYQYDVFFDRHGYMVMEKWNDPVMSPTVHTFSTGPGGNLASYEKSTNDSRIANHIVVVGTGNGNDVLPIISEALNEEPQSPTNISKLGDRIFEMTSSLVTNQSQGDAIAQARLRIMALEQYDLNLETLVVPWLDVGGIVEFDDPDPDPNDPTRFLLSNFTIPMSLGTMKATGRRVTIVG